MAEQEAALKQDDEPMVAVRGEASMQQQSALPPAPAAWPHRPLFVRKSVVAHGLTDAGEAPLCIGDAFPIETDLFVGQAMLRLRSTPGTDAYFFGKARQTSFVVSGRFKRPLRFAQLYTGQEFAQPLRISSSTRLVVRAVLKAIRMLAPLLRVRLSDAGSYLLSPLVQTAQVMHVGTAPVALHRGLVVSEDTSLVGGALSGGGAGAGAGAGVTAAERRRFFSVRSNLVGLSFDPGLVYTPRGCVAKVGCTPRA
jgi:hypothetical protein